MTEEDPVDAPRHLAGWVADGVNSLLPAVRELAAEEFTQHLGSQVAVGVACREIVDLATGLFDNGPSDMVYECLKDLVVRPVLCGDVVEQARGVEAVGEVDEDQRLCCRPFATRHNVSEGRPNFVDRC